MIRHRRASPRFRRRRPLERSLSRAAGGPRLENGARIGVVGGGPAGSLFAIFALRMAELADLELEVEIFEPRRFTHCGPAGCNHCGGIVSESLVQLLATEGINLPGRIVQRGIDSYVLHADVGDVRIEAPLREKRIASVYRGNGPRGGRQVERDIVGFDQHLQERAAARGARVRRRLVEGARWRGEAVELSGVGFREVYDLVVVATGVNSRFLQAVRTLAPSYEPPRTVGTFICEYELGREAVRELLGTSMHVFLLDIPRLEFAALIPKGEFASLCMLGEGIDEELVEAFLASPEVRSCFPGGEVPEPVCHCFPRINLEGVPEPYSDRIVFIGDSGVTRLYKDGIGAAYRTAKAAAATAVLHGVSAAAFRRHYGPTCRDLRRDNALGKVLFTFSGLMQRRRFSRRGMVRMIASEQRTEGAELRMSTVLWDTFTGSAPYREIFSRSLRPGFVTGLLWNVLAANWPWRNGGNGGS